MTQRADIPAPADFDAWRAAARDALSASLAPHDIIWSVGGERLTGDLFASAPPEKKPGNATGIATPTVPKAFLDLAKSVVCHSDPDRFSLLYRLLWRLQSERHLLDIAADADVQRAEALAKAVRRDKHKMTAFVRFREVKDERESVWIAWFEPQHHIVEATAPFFVRRFASMKWSILTPERCAHWDGATLSFTPGTTRADAPSEDALEDHWRTYFSAIFNPARLNTQAMQREMPKKYWKNMPETGLIPDLIRSAARRTETMLANPPPAPRVSIVDREADSMRKARSKSDLPDAERPTTLSSLATLVEECRRCPLWRDATQAVAGVGPSNAQLMIVGEQPGDQEDLQGQPFVGPAGKVLSSALAEAGLPRAALYLTNAVKHFKFEPRGKRRLHKKPNAAEIDVCRWWLSHEVNLLRPKLIVALGSTAAQSLLQRPVKVTTERGQILQLPEGPKLIMTVHPSYLLRLQDPATTRVEQSRFVDDLRKARRVAGELGIALEAA